MTERKGLEAKIAKMMGSMEKNKDNINRAVAQRKQEDVARIQQARLAAGSVLAASVVLLSKE